jgi:hypothetical protein
VPNITIEPLGGSGDTDIVVHVNSNGLEIAKVLLENKNRSSWSNAFLAQLEHDMAKTGAHFGILVTTALPKNAKSRGYALTEKNGIIVITAPELAGAVALVLYDILLSLERLSAKSRMLHEVLQSKELVECLASNLSLVEPLRDVIKITDKAHTDVTSGITRIIDAIEQNNSRLLESLSSRGSGSDTENDPQSSCDPQLSGRPQ